jgi:ankyrin repeat protein
MPAKSKRLKCGSPVEDKYLAEFRRCGILVELNAQDIQNGQMQESSSSSKNTSPVKSSTEESVDRWLAENGRASGDEANIDGNTPLWSAASWGDLSMVRWSG